MEEVGMPGFIRSNSTEVSRSRPVLGFTVRTGAPAWFEIALTTDPRLLGADAKARRTRENFYSTRGLGPLPADRGEAVWLVPPSVLARFVGQERLYYSLATYADRDRMHPEVLRLPPEAAPSVFISKSFSGSLRRLSGVPNLGGGLLGNGGNGAYGGGNGTETLEWAGDLAEPGTVEPTTPPMTQQPAASMPTPPAADGAPPAAVAAGNGNPVAVEYSDGFDDDLFAQPLDEAGHAPDPDERGIDGPVPELSPELAQAAGAADPQPEYPQAARFAPADPGNFAAGPETGRSIERIVVHITGGTTIASPIWWFQDPTAGVSAHYVIGQDGEVVQMVRHDDVAQHAHGANRTSIGIEHVAKPKALFPSSAQYAASAALVRWLCDRYGIPIDRAHIVGHSEIDPVTKHTDCPNSVWDWDAYMAMVTAAASLPATPLGATSDLPYDVPLIPQPNKTSCWAASMAMLLSYQRKQSFTPERVAEETGQSLNTCYGWSMLQGAKQHFGFQEIPLPFQASLYPSPEQWHDWLAAYGPLWVGYPNHAVVLYGMNGDQTPAGTTMLVRDPWDDRASFDRDPIDFHPPNHGRSYEQPFAEFAERFARPDYGDYADFRVLYLTAPLAGGQAFAAAASRTAAQALGTTPFDVHWDDVQVIPQPTDVSCWATAAAMVMGWRDRLSLRPEDVAAMAGRTTSQTFRVSEKRAVAKAFRLAAEPPQSYTIEGLRALLETKGPLWVGAITPLGGHAVVVTGLYGDGAPDGTGTYVRVSDPWDRDPGVPGAPGAYRESHEQGSRYVLAWAEFVAEYEERVSETGGVVDVQVIHAGGTNGRTIGTGTEPALARQADAVVALASVILGTTLERVLNNEGDIHSELDHLKGVQLPRDKKELEGSSAYRPETVKIKGPVRHVEWGVTERPVFVDLRLLFDYNGRSVGNIVMDVAGSADPIGAGVTVKATIGRDENVYTRSGSVYTPMSGDEGFAAIPVHIHYIFDFGASDNAYYAADLKLYGDGTHTLTGDWLQE